MKPIYVKNCRECPSCMINTETAACYAYRFINNEDLYMDLEMLEDIPEECPMNTSEGITLTVDPDYLNDFEDDEEFEFEDSSEYRNVEDEFKKR